jgi:hypothetical protein
MGLIPEDDRRPRDWGYKVAFDRKDLPSLEEMARHIRETHDTDMIEDFNLKCEQKLSGKSAVLDNGIEIEQVTKTEDLAVNVGLQQCVNLILGTNSNYWVNFGLTKNAGTSLPSVTDTNLQSSAGGPWFLSLATYGWSEPKGMKMFFGTITPQDASSSFNANAIQEMGIAGNAGTPLLNREVFFSNPINRSLSADGQMYKQVFIFSCVIEFCPVA